MSTMSPFDNEQRLYSDPTQIDAAMFNRFKGKRMFKVGQTERMVYEKVGGLKMHNVVQSLLYNFSSEGAFSEIGLPIALVGPTAKEIEI